MIGAEEMCWLRRDKMATKRDSRVCVRVCVGELVQTLHEKEDELNAHLDELVVTKVELAELMVRSRRPPRHSQCDGEFRV